MSTDDDACKSITRKKAKPCPECVNSSKGKSMPLDDGRYSNLINLLLDGRLVLHIMDSTLDSAIGRSVAEQYC